MLGLIGGLFLKYVLPTLATVIGGLVAAILRKYLKKAGLELSAEQQAQLEKKVIDAILRAEEAGRRNEDITGAEKVDMAVRDVLEATNNKLDPSTVRLIIDQALPLVRARLKGTERLPVEPPLYGRH